MPYPIYKVVEKVTTYETYYLTEEEIAGLPQTAEDPLQWQEWAGDAVEDREPDHVYYDGNVIVEVAGCKANRDPDYEYFARAY